VSSCNKSLYWLLADPFISASAPTFASVVANLNSARLSRHQPPLGFLNPFIYSVGYKGLTDIVDGGSNGCTGIDIYSRLPTPFVPYASWNATEGWDPVTGYGTPTLQKLLVLSACYRGGDNSSRAVAE